MKFAAIVIALGIALVVTMGPAPASAQAIVIRECGDDYVVTRYNQDGSVKGVWNKQLSAQGTIYTGGQTWKLVEGNPDRFVSDGGAQLQVVACDATPGSGARGLGGVQQDGAQAQSSTTNTLVSNIGQSSPVHPHFDYIAISVDRAQSFTTGVQDTTLTRVDIVMQTTHSHLQPTFVVEIWSGDSAPSTKVGSLGGRSALSVASWKTEKFAASGNGIDLAANTKYWVVIDASKSTSAARVRIALEDGEDPGAAAGWSIGDGHVSWVSSSSTWRPPPNWPLNAYSVKINVVGYALTPVVYDGGQAFVNRAASADRDTLWDYFYDSCSAARSLTTVHDYSLFDYHGRRIQARNGWKWVEVQNATGAVTHTRPQTVDECASHGMYLRQQTCANDEWIKRNPHLLDSWCPDNRTW